MLLPKSIQSKFLSIAEPNTRKKIETCGILAGTLVKKESNDSKLHTTNDVIVW